MSDKKQWAIHGNTIVPCGETTNKLEPGMYRPRVSMMGPYLQRHKLLTDKLICVGGLASMDVMESIKRFHESKELYQRFGMVHKRGILLHGKPGVGKSATVAMVAEDMVKRGGIVLITPTSHPEGFEALKVLLHLIRDIHPEMPIVNIMEDLDKVSDYEKSYPGMTTSLLALLDGEDQVGNVVHIATTNFINKLDSRIVSRPSRFDEVIEVLPCGPEARWEYFRTLVGQQDVTDEELGIWVEVTQGLNIACLKEFMLSVMVLGKTPQETAKRLQGMIALGNKQSLEEQAGKAIQRMYVSSPGLFGN